MEAQLLGDDNATGGDYYHSWIDITFSAIFFVLICLNLLQLGRSCLFWRKQDKYRRQSQRITHKRTSSSVNDVKDIEAKWNNNNQRQRTFKESFGDP